MDGACRGASNDAVKVLYSLDSSPQHTMIARGARRTMVRVAQGPAPLGALGRVALKTCLGAICVASPELVLDRANDYIVYAVDPEESHRAMQRSPTHRVGDAAASPSRRGAAQVLVGKGFLSGALEEPGEGTSAVTGRVRAEARHSFSAFSSDEDEDGGTTEVLEVVLRMKEAPQQSREQYQHLLQGIGESSRSASAPRTSPVRPAEQRQLMSMLHRIADALPDAHARAAPAPTPAPTPPAAPTRADRICYNCGTTTSKTWRMLQLPAGEPVPHPASERPPADAVPLTWTPKYAAHTQCTADGETRWQACNACGLYFAKYGTSRSERMCAARREPRAAKKIKAEDTPSGTPAPAAPRSSRGRALQDLSANASPVRRAASSPGHADRMPPPRAAVGAARTRAATPEQYGMPAYMIHSSPGTAMDRLLHETDQDFREMHPSGDFPTPGKLLAVRATLPTSPSPVRRSPRKRPHGTLAQVNPYATLDVAAHSDPGLFAAAPAHAPPAHAQSSPARRPTSSPGLWTRARRRPTLDAASLALPLDDAAEGPPSPSADRAERASRSERRAAAWTPPAAGVGGAQAPVRPTPPRAEAPVPVPAGDVFGEDAWLRSSPLTPEARPAAADAAKDADAAAADATPAPAHAPARARRPLPATVEDASSSQPSTPRHSPESAVEYIEDPYGLLGASGLAAYDEEGNVTLGEGLSLEALNGIELHGAESFGEHLRDFTAQGGLGLAAHLGQAQTPHVESFGGAPAPDGGLAAMLDDPGVLALLANCHGDTPQPEASAAPVAST